MGGTVCVAVRPTVLSAQAGLPSAQPQTTQLRESVPQFGGGGSQGLPSRRTAWPSDMQASDGGYDPGAGLEAGPSPSVRGPP